MTKQKYVYNKYVSLDDYLKTLGYDVQFGLVHGGVTKQWYIIESRAKREICLSIIYPPVVLSMGFYEIILKKKH